MTSLTIRKIFPDEAREIYERMYRPYVNELKQYSGGDGMLPGQLIYMLSQGKVKLYVGEIDKEYAGFVLSEDCSDSFPEDMEYLMEFYILPKYRNQGIGEELFRKYLETFKGSFFFYALPDNTKVIGFWEYILKKFELKQVCPYPEIMHFGKGLLSFQVYRP